MTEDRHLISLDCASQKNIIEEIERELQDDSDVESRYLKALTAFWELSAFGDWYLLGVSEHADYVYDRIFEMLKNPPSECGPITSAWVEYIRFISAEVLGFDPPVFDKGGLHELMFFSVSCDEDRFSFDEIKGFDAWLDSQEMSPRVRYMKSVTSGALARSKWR